MRLHEVTPLDRHLWRIALLVAAVLSGCDGSTPTPTRIFTSPPTPTATTQQPGTSDNEMSVAPCETVTETADPLLVAEQDASLPTVPTQSEDEEVEGGDLPPLVEEQDAQPVAVEQRDATTPSAYDPNDPRALTVFASHEFSDRTHTTAEPEVAVNGERVLVTWNKGAAMSSDLGATFAPANPLDYGVFPNVGYGFCCDQLARYDAGHGLWLWVLQYEHRKPGDEKTVRPNRIRLGVAKGDAAFDARAFSYLDLIPQRLGFSNVAWFDRSQMGLTERYMYLGIHAFNGPVGETKYEGEIVLRIALDELAAGGPISPTCLWPRWPYQTDTGSRLRIGHSLFPIRGATNTMYFGAHFSRVTLSVLRWPDDDASPTLHWVREPVQGGGGYVAFNTSTPQRRFHCSRQGVQPEAATDWCEHADARILSGWKAGSQLGFAWNAGQDTTTGNLYPFMWATVLDETRLTSCQTGECVLGRPSLAFTNAAIQYMAIVPDDAGDLAGVALVGGGAFDLQCLMLVHDSVTSADPRSDLYWDIDVAASSAKDVSPPKFSGDYMGAWPDGGGPHTWSGSCMTMQGSPTIRESTVHFLRFGRLNNKPGS